jgi:membrane-bound ClpP family serine protease
MPGFNLVSAMANVVRVTPGSGANHVLGLVGVAETELSPDRAVGTIRVGDTQLSARGAGPINAGARVRVIKDSLVGEVLVAREGAATLGSSPSASPSQGEPLR